MKTTAGEAKQALDAGRAREYFADFWRAHPYATIEYAGRDWPYLRAGGGNGRPVVFLSGGGLDPGMWAYQLNELGQGRRVIAPSFGLVPEPFHLRAEAIRAILNHEGIGEAVFCGHSYGGLLAQFFASRFPEMAPGLILTNTFLPTPDLVARLRRKKLRIVKHLPLWVIRAALRKRLADMPGSAWNAYRREYLQGLYSRVEQRRLVLFYSTLVETLQEELPAFTPAPGRVLLVSSRDDTDTRDRFPELAGAYPGADTRIFEAGGHHTPMLFPEEFTRLAGEFVDRR